MEKKEKKENKNKNLSRIILVVVLVTGSAIGFIKYREAQHYETTDDAQLVTDITPVSARVSGYIAKVYIADNQLVKKGDTIVTLDDRDLKIKVEQTEAAFENSKALFETAKVSALSVLEGGGTSVFKIDEF